LQAGLLASGSCFRRTFPSLSSRQWHVSRRSSPVTAARPRPILTALSFYPASSEAPANSLTIALPEILSNVVDEIKMSVSYKVFKNLKQNKKGYAHDKT